MDTTTIVIIVIAALVLLVVGGFLGLVFARRQRSKKLQERFGPEYDRMVKQLGDKDEAESQLVARVEHVKSLDIQPLSPEEKERFAHEWRQIQAMFVDRPGEAIQDANRLVEEVMAAKGYPVEDYEKRIEDLSVDYPELISNYRRVHKVVVNGGQDRLSTEELRQAMVHCRALFEELLGTEVKPSKVEKEKV
jgi:uncharacterized protein with von Willebrand factor type A (vWA) domain